VVCGEGGITLCPSHKNSYTNTHTHTALTCTHMRVREHTHAHIPPGPLCV